MKSDIRVAFFGTPEFAAHVADELERAGFAPALVVTRPDAPAGRGLNLAPPPMKTWAEKHGIPVLQPEKLDDDFLRKIEEEKFDVGVVAAYGKILPKRLLDAPKRGMLNVHPSLLPRFRGASPVEAALLEGCQETGVSIIALDSEMDHGPVLAQESFRIPLGMRARALERTLARHGGELLARTLPSWVEGSLTAAPQDHARATYTKKISKEDGRLDLEGDPLINYRKYRAFEGWPRVYFEAKRHGENVRVIVTEAAFENGTFVIKRVLPEGRREMSYEDFLRGN